MPGNWPRGLNAFLGAVLGILLAAAGIVFYLAERRPGDGWDLAAKKDVVGVVLLAVGALTVAVSLLSLRWRRT